MWISIITLRVAYTKYEIKPFNITTNATPNGPSLSVIHRLICIEWTLRDLKQRVVCPWLFITVPGIPLDFLNGRLSAGTHHLTFYLVGPATCQHRPLITCNKPISPVDKSLSSVAVCWQTICINGHPLSAFNPPGKVVLLQDSNRLVSRDSTICLGLLDSPCKNNSAFPKYRNMSDLVIKTGKLILYLVMWFGLKEIFLRLVLL